MYTTTWCGYCQRLKRQLTEADIAFEEVDIEQNPDAAKLIEQHNGGNQTVPTLIFSDGTSLTNPSVKQVQEKLLSLS